MIPGPRLMALESRALHRIPLLLTTLLIALLALSLLPLSPARADEYHVDRIGGADRYAVAANTALTYHTPEFPTDTVYIASGQIYSDALGAGAAAAGDGNAVLLLTRQGSLPTATVKALEKLRPRTIKVIGGTATISSSVENALKPYALERVVRIAGKDRYEVAANVSRDLGAWSGTVYVASGAGFSDAVAAAGFASVLGDPVLLTSPGGLPSSIAAELRRMQPERIVVVGGAASVSDGVLASLRSYGPTVRVGGADRYEVSVNLSKDLSGRFQQFAGDHRLYFGTVTSGTAFADSLSAANLHQPVLFTRPTALPSTVTPAFARYGIEYVTIVGGEATVSTAVERQLWGLTPSV
ncbi:cell wall-binding repeat-containing protein [Brachybacterium muris]|uniref:cell wall-binding repeat-containing protein n=1 Tax=Brachybacterium muris TaxID=219301 RepID=UPI00223AD2FA|nr:cell wall-binding repeat-containing protein [Brachybacterium muris]MCT2177703.1 cell wall-binding repeat-containing protein [Brachybacterium muris]